MINLIPVLCQSTNLSKKYRITMKLLTKDVVIELRLIDMFANLQYYNLCSRFLRMICLTNAEAIIQINISHIFVGWGR